jgi:hypothetical protein
MNSHKTSTAPKNNTNTKTYHIPTHRSQCPPPPHLRGNRFSVQVNVNKCIILDIKEGIHVFRRKAGRKETTRKTKTEVDG